MNITRDSQVSAVATEVPATMKIFQEQGIDFCCGGKRPLAEACADRGLDVDVLIDRLQGTIADADAGRNWRAAPACMPFLVRGFGDLSRPGRAQSRDDRRGRHRDRGGKRRPSGPARSSPWAGPWPCPQDRTRRAIRPHRCCTRSSAITTTRSEPRRRSFARARACRVSSTTSSTRSCDADGTLVGSRASVARVAGKNGWWRSRARAAGSALRVAGVG